MDLISTHIIKKQDLGVHGALFGGTLLSMIDESKTRTISRAIMELYIRNYKLMTSK